MMGAMRTGEIDKLAATVRQLVEDNDALQRLILAMADKLEICSRLLGKCAERRACQNCKGATNGIPGVSQREIAIGEDGRVRAELDA